MWRLNDVAQGKLIRQAQLVCLDIKVVLKTQITRMPDVVTRSYCILLGLFWCMFRVLNLSLVLETCD